MKCALVLCVVVCIIAAVLGFEEEGDDVVLSQGFFEIVNEIYSKLRQLREYIWSNLLWNILS